MPTLVHTAIPHAYWLDGEEIPGNTFLLEWGGLVDTAWFTPEAAERGTRVHNGAHFLCEGDLDWDTVLPQDRGYVEAVEKFLRFSGFVVEANEFPVWSAHRYATKPDLLGRLNVNGLVRRVLVQFKTGDIHAHVGVQLGLEKIAVNERIHAQDEDWARRLEWVNDSPYVDGRFALRLFNDGRYKLHPEFDDPQDEIVGLGIVAKYYWQKKHNYKVRG